MNLWLLMQLLLRWLDEKTRRDVLSQLVAWIVSWKKWARGALLVTKRSIYSDGGGLRLAGRKFVHFCQLVVLSPLFNYSVHFVVATNRHACMYWLVASKAAAIGCLVLNGRQKSYKDMSCLSFDRTRNRKRERISAPPIQNVYVLAL